MGKEKSHKCPSKKSYEKLLPQKLSKCECVNELKFR